ncbi:MAG: response regulator [Pseudomonadota bacterium]
MKRILFVDDEVNILQGLKRMLRSMRREWDMHFANGAEQALQMMDEEPFDIVVTDMRMPVHDGAYLLANVKARYPDTARIILSGHAEQEAAIRSVAAAHQFLAKPCDAETLRATVARTCRLRDMMRNKSLQRMATEIGQLPSVPSIYQEMSAEMGKDEPSMKVIGAIVSSDLAMSAKVLQLVNSAFFGLRRQMSSIDQAVAYLGMDVIRSLVLSESAFKSLSTKHCPVSSETLLRNGQMVAQIAKAIAKDSCDTRTVVDEAFQAGLMHELGTLILANGRPDDYAKVNANVTNGMSTGEAEQTVFGVTQGEVGAYLLGLWGLSDGIVEAIAFCRRPGASDVSEFAPLVALHVARGLLRESRGHAEQLNLDWLDSIGLSLHIPQWRSIGAELLNAKDAA